MELLSIAYIAPIETMTLLQAANFSSARRWFIFSSRWVATVVHAIFSFRVRLQSSLDSASIALMSHSVKFIFYQSCYQFRVSVRVLTSIPRLSAPPGVGSGACALRGAPATVLVTPALLRRWRFALGRSSTSALPNSRFTIQHSFLIEPQTYKSLMVPRSTFLISVIRNLTGDFREASRGSTLY